MESPDGLGVKYEIDFVQRVILCLVFKVTLGCVYCHIVFVSIGLRGQDKDHLIGLCRKNSIILSKESNKADKEHNCDKYMQSFLAWNDVYLTKYTSQLTSVLHCTGFQFWA